MFYVCARALLAAITAQSFAGGMSVCRDESGPAVKYRRLDCSAHKVLLGSAPTSPRGSRALSPVPTRVGFFAARRGTRSVQIYFLHLLWFLQRGPGTFLQPERGIGGVSAWNQLCQHPPPTRASAGPGGFLWQRAPLHISSTTSSTTSATTSSVPVNMQCALLASFGQTLTHLVHTAIRYLPVGSSE